MCIYHIVCFAIIYFKDTTIRPVLKHGPRSSTGLRVVEYNTKLTRRSESKICAMYAFYVILQHGLIMDMRREFSLCVYVNFFLVNLFTIN